MNNVLQGIQEVFTQARYILYSMLIAVIFFVINVVITNYRLIEDFIERGRVLGVLQLIITLTLGSYHSMAARAFYSLLIIAILVGITFTLILYRMKTLRAFSLVENKTGSIGAIMGLIVPGCASCGIGLLSAVGLGGALVKLPFQGFELTVLSAALLIYSAGAIAQKIGDGVVCQVQKKRK